MFEKLVTLAVDVATVLLVALAIALVMVNLPFQP